jgi:hypothetical protein
LTQLCFVHKLRPKRINKIDCCCKSGYSLAGITPNNLTFLAACPYGGGSFSLPTWPVCAAAATGRKKRFIDYKSIYSDIDYTVLALFETQFMHTK